MPTPKKLYEIEITTKVYVTADDNDDALDVAFDAISSGDVDFDRRDVDAFQITESRFIDKDWKAAYPFGGDGSETCQQLAVAWEEYERTRTSTAKELEALGQQTLIRGRSEGGRDEHSTP